ncbi:MAG: hypothetical protein MJA29_10075 [Candidatus Omnitrophica bacterium]|nr:hypothetical protein [Candidatus Omnitrophota bacterium]
MRATKVTVFDHKRFFRVLDEAVEEAGVRNAAGFRIKGFPFLRANRFLTGLKERAITAEQKQLWVELMRQYDLSERSKEIHNLPVSALSSLCDLLPDISSRKDIFQRLISYSERYAAAERAHPAFIEKLKRKVRDPGVYSLAMRVFGLYPLIAPVVEFATAQVYETFRKWHKTPMYELPVRGTLTAYAPANRIDLVSVPLAAMMEESRRDALGIPRLSKEEIEIIAKTFAPVLSIDVTGDHDRLGEVQWRDGKLTVDCSNPAVYYYPSYTLLGRRVHLQINYAFWYRSRSGKHAPWIERGPLDGMTLRVTLDKDGMPLIADITNNCGCYYFALPRNERVAEVIKRPGKPDPLVPGWLPDTYPEQPLKLRINTGWHQVQHVDAGMPDQSLTYRLTSYETLEILPSGEETTESAFTSSGIMKGSWRLEPFLFFSMGIPKVGYMRQRGNHAIKLTGRAHFTDPYLFERDFKFK